jgi:hypothetical protein
MTTEPLRKALRVRRLAIREAQRELADRLGAEQLAAAAAIAAAVAIQHEIALAMDITRGDEAVAALAAWLPHGRAEATRATAALVRAEAATAHARAMLAAARAAEASIAELLERRAQAAAAHEHRAEQAALDEYALCQGHRAASGTR